MTFEIRDLRAGDLDAVARIIDLCDDDDTSPALRDFQEYLGCGGRCRAKANFVIGRPAGPLLGVVGYFVDREHEPGCDVFWGSWFYVNPEAQGTGAGKALWFYLREHLREIGCRKVYANVSSDPAYDRARLFYRAAGFVCEHAHPGYFAAGEHSEIWAARTVPLRAQLSTTSRPEVFDDGEVEAGAGVEAEAPAPLRLREAKPRHAPDIARLFESYGRPSRVRAEAFVWRHFHRADPERRLYVAGASGEGLVGVAAVEQADEEEVDKEVFWIRHLCAKPGRVDSAAPLLLRRIEQRQRARGARRLYTSVPGTEAFSGIVDVLGRAGFLREGALPDYYADGVPRVFYVKELEAPGVGAAGSTAKLEGDPA